MGRVYRAFDTVLTRSVALKILPAEFMASGDRVRRFEQEARTASALNHPAVVTIYELGVVDLNRESERAVPHHFIAMELVDGDTLRERLEHGRLDLKKGLEWIADIAEGLAAAHGAGIIHRDLKPENLMISSSGYPKILDFGLAKLRERLPANASPEQSATVPMETAPGTMMGTVAYMSPEQAAGRDVDHRSDIFALGSILYEIVARRRPFAGDSAIETLHRVIHSEPEPIRDVAPDAPLQLQWIIRKCLAKDPEERYQSAKELALDLREVRREIDSQPSAVHRTAAAGHKRTLTTAGAFLIVAAILGSAAFFLAHQRANQEGPTPIRSIAVLPFRNLSGEEGEEYFSDGMTESLITALANIEGLKVISRGSVFRFKEKEVDLQDVGRHLGVAVILEGSVRKRGDVVRVNVRLVRVEDGFVLWVHDTKERSLSDIFALQDRIAGDVAVALRLKLGEGQGRPVTAAVTTNVEAYQLYLRGQYHLGKWKLSEVEKSIHYFQRAIEIEPAYALAYVGLANAYFALQPLDPRPAHEVMPKAKAAALRALELDDQLAEAHAALAFVHYSYEWDWVRAEKEFQRAIQLNPNSAMSHDQYSWYLADMGRFDEAFAEIGRALELDPLSANIHRDSAFIFYYARQYDRAIEQCQKIRELDPHFWQAYFWLGRSYEAKGLLEQAVEADLEAAEVAGTSPEKLAARKAAYATAGPRGYWQRRLQEAKDQEKQRYYEPYTIAGFYVRLGDKEQALNYLEKAYEVRSAAWMTTINNDALLDPLRFDPRFQALVRRMDLVDNSPSLRRID